jgi:probable O-glycosylation ligase (exosortase A-associated)
LLRGLLLISFISGATFATMAAPHLGVLVWIWLTVMNPHRFVYGFGDAIPYNFIVAATTLLCWLFSAEPKRFRFDLVLGIFVLLGVYYTVTTLTSLSPDLSFILWDRTVKSMVLALVVSAVIINRVRIDSVIWVIVISLGYFGIKGGGFTLLLQGSSHVFGPPDSPIADNNHLALALCVSLPLMNYLFGVTRARLVKLGLAGTMGLTTLAVLGTYSRGGMIGLAVMLGFLWLKSRHKIAIAMVAVVLGLPALHFMPEKWFGRMQTIETAQEDGSFQERLNAWGFALAVAKARPLLGSGFGACEDTAVWTQYQPDLQFQGDWVRGRAMHSIYFEVLADHGYVALALFVAMLGLTWLRAGRVARLAPYRPGLEWSARLASMIRISLTAYMVAGAALSMAYWDVIFTLIALVSVLRRLLAEADRATVGAASPNDRLNDRLVAAPASV